MITFEQFVSKKQSSYEKIQIAQLNVLRRLIEAEPFNFKWVAAKDVAFTEETIVAKRAIKCDNIETQKNETDFVVMFNPNIGYTKSEVHITYPILKWNQPDFYNEDLKIDYADLESFIFFYVYDQAFELEETSFRLSSKYSLQVFFDPYNFYIAQEGTKVEKMIKTLEYVKPIWSTNGSNSWGSEEDKLLFRVKMKYQRHLATKRDFIRGAMLDL